MKYLLFVLALLWCTNSYSQDVEEYLPYQEDALTEDINVIVVEASKDGDISIIIGEPYYGI